MTEDFNRPDHLNYGDFQIDIQYYDDEEIKKTFQAFSQTIFSGCFGHGETELEALKDLKKELDVFAVMVEPLQKQLEIIISNLESSEQRPTQIQSNIPARQSSLLNCAIEILAEKMIADEEVKAAGMNCSEIIDALRQDGRYVFSDARTPDQSLYTAIQREIQKNGNERIYKSTRVKGYWKASDAEIEKARVRLGI